MWDEKVIPSCTTREDAPDCPRFRREHASQDRSALRMIHEAIRSHSFVHPPTDTQSTSKGWTPNASTKPSGSIAAGPAAIGLGPVREQVNRVEWPAERGDSLVTALLRSVGQ